MSGLIGSNGKTIDLSAPTPDPVSCANCGSQYFVPVYVLLKRVGILNKKSPLDGYEAVASFKCAQCGTVVKDLDPLEE